MGRFAGDWRGAVHGVASPFPCGRVMGRILIVEDNVDLAEGIAFNLKLEGHETLIAADGRKGIDAFRSFAPDLVLLDLMLPGVDGYEVLRSIRGQGPRV